MALSDTNRALKALLGKLGTSDSKRLIEEFSGETLSIHFNEVWTEDIDPDPAAAIAAGVVEQRTLFALTEDVTVANKEAWRTIESGSPLIDWVPPDKFGPNYTTDIYDGNNNLITKATQINEGMLFDYKTGILTINGDALSFTHPFKITGYRYIGQKGGAVGGPEGQLGDLFNCAASVALGDAVYISGADTVEKASAEAGPGQTPDAIGVVVSKPTSTTCRVVGRGLSPAIFSGLVVGTTYYVSEVTPGLVTATAPSSPGAKVQEVGQAASPTKLFIDVDATSIEI